MRRIHKHLVYLFFLLAISSTIVINCTKEKQVPKWPEISQESKPWTRWWWLGNILEEKELSNAMKQYAEAGLGGLEITPIYGVKGQENNFIKYLSDEWVEKFLFTLDEARKNDLGIDMATGTGWPFGGPWVTPDDASKYMVYKSFYVSKGTSLGTNIEYYQYPISRMIGEKYDLSQIKQPIADNDNLQQLALEQIRFSRPLPLVVLMAYGENGEVLDLTDKVSGWQLDWTAPDCDWILYAVFRGWHGKMVERAAPGGEGYVIDHFDKKAVFNYFHKFDRSLESEKINSLRAFFNDSYEVDDARGQANFTPKIFEEFSSRRGYDLREHLDALFGEDTIDHVKVLMDYRLTISELLLDNFTKQWGEWANKNKALIRNQAHGSPANILDLYAASDIPETEGKDILKIKFATSASHVAGKKLTSSESATWLDEHFLSTLDKTKKNIDRFLLGGVNHVFYHGTPYSPSTEPWPGFMFYASVHYAPTNTFWDDFKAFNHYVSRCQSFLQQGKPDNDILLYFPFHDRLAIKENEILQHFSGSGIRGKETEFRSLAKSLLDKGYSFDYISDKQLAEVNCKRGDLFSIGNDYKAIVVPSCKYMPTETIEHLEKLAKKGANIIFHKNLPDDVPGYRNYRERKDAFVALTAALEFKEIQDKGYFKTSVGRGMILKGNNIDAMLDASNIFPEIMVANGLHYIRKTNHNGNTYFIKNTDTLIYDGWITINVFAKSAVLFNPLNDDFGVVGLEKINGNKSKIYLQLNPSQSIILRTYDQEVECDPYNYIRPNANEYAISEPWDVSFVKGGPSQPLPITLSSLQSWTELGEDDYKYFSGTAKYVTKFSKPDDDAHAFILDLGEVCESARVILNGEEMGTLFTHPYKIVIPSDKLKEKNEIEIFVSNLMANRIIYMDREKIDYRRFYNINFPARRRENRNELGLFTTQSKENPWQPLESGLLGPVVLMAAEYVNY